jgi:mRNA interferase RelE/StbE
MKQLTKIDKYIAKRIDEKLHEISTNPFLYVSKLVSVDLYKLRVGDYGVLMNIKQDKLIILVVQISHRHNVYK